MGGFVSPAIRKLANWTGTVYEMLGPREGQMGVEISTTAKASLQGHWRPLGGEEIALVSGAMNVNASHVLITDSLEGANQGDRVEDTSGNQWSIVHISRNGFPGNYIYRIYLRARG